MKTPAKKNQRQIDVSNEKLVSKTDETNKLLKELIKAQKDTTQITPRDEYIPNGIDNTSDIMAIRGLD